MRFPFWGPVLSGLLIGTGYIPFPPWAVFFCFVPLWLFALNNDRLKPLLIGGFICQSVVTLIGFNWIVYTIKALEILFWPQGFILILLFIIFSNLHISLSLFFWFLSNRKLKNIKSSLIRGLCIGCSLPVYLALCTQYYPMTFKWHLGYTWFYANWPAVQTAEIWGFQFISTFILFSNLIFLFIFKSGVFQIAQSFTIRVLKHCSLLLRFKKFNHFLISQRGKLLKPVSADNSNIPFFSLPAGLVILCSWSVVFVFLQFFGLYLKNRLPLPDRKARVLMVQPNIANEMQEEKKWSDFILSKILEETMKNLPYKFDRPVDFILWPEGTYPYGIDLLRAERLEDPIQKIVAELNTPLLTSARGDKKEGYTNAFFAFDRKGQLIQPPYNKEVLIPFGEYTPGEKWFPFINKFFFEDQRSFVKGTGSNKVVTLDNIRLGLHICYEGLFDWFIRDVAQEGIDILVNVSNDAWFGNWQEPWQHLYMTLSRAIEIRRPLVRGTNSGFSAVVSAGGDVSSPMVLGQSFSQIKEVAFYSKDRAPSSLFTSWGCYINQVFLWLCLFLIHFLLYFLRKKNY